MSDATVIVPESPPFTIDDVGKALAGQRPACEKIIRVIRQIHLDADQLRKSAAVLLTKCKRSGERSLKADAVVVRLLEAAPTVLDPICAFVEKIGAGSADGIFAVVEREAQLSEAEFQHISALESEARRMSKAATEMSDLAEKYEGALVALGLGDLIAEIDRPKPVPVAPKAESVNRDSAPAPRRQIVTVERERNSWQKLCQAFGADRDTLLLADKDNADTRGVALKRSTRDTYEVLASYGVGVVPVGHHATVQDLILSFGPDLIEGRTRKLGITYDAFLAALPKQFKAQYARRQSVQPRFTSTDNSTMGQALLKAGVVG